MYSPRLRHVKGVAVIGSTAVMAGTLYRLYGSHIPRAVSSAARQVNDLVNWGFVPDANAPIAGAAARRRRGGAWSRRRAIGTARVVLALKAQFGHMSDSGPNREVLRRAALKYMRDRGGRDHDVAMIVPVAVSLYFVPSDAEIASKQVDACAVKARQTLAYNRTWWSFGSLMARCGLQRPLV